MPHADNEEDKMKIVTGYKGTPHISSNDQQAFNQGIFGSGNYVLDVGNKFGAELTNVNTVTISDGEGVLQGVHFRIEPGETETINIANGTTGTSRIDLICARYTKDAATGIENVSLVLIPGDAVESNPEVPEYNTGDILNGESPVDFPLYKVSLNGLTPSLVVMFSKKGSMTNSPDLSNISLLDEWNSTDPDQDITFTESGWYMFRAYNTSASELFLKGYSDITIPYFAYRIPSYANAEATSGWLYFDEGETMTLTFTMTGNCSMFFAPCK